MKNYSRRIELHKATLWKGKSSLLGHLDMELTERCNNNCIHCYINLHANDFKAKQKELPTEDIKEILQEAVSLGCLSVRFTGGEPLLREDFEEIYLAARKLGLKVVIFTNATLITSHLTALFSRVPPPEEIEVSVYGMNKRSYEAVTRVHGSFEVAWRGIHLLLEKNIPFVVKSAILPSNRGEIEDFEAWAATIPWMDRPPTYSMFFELSCRPDSEKSRLIEKLRISPDDGLKVLLRRKDDYMKQMKGFCNRFIGLPGEKLFTCGAGRGMGCVDAYGHFQLCMLLRHPDTVYDLKYGSLKDALENFFVRIRAMKAFNRQYLNHCARCFLKSLCEQCPARSWMENRTLDTPVDYFCEVAHVEARFLGLLQEGEKAWEVKDWEERVKKFTENSISG